MAKKYADIVIRATVEFFEDTAEDALCLVDQAHEAAMDQIAFDRDIAEIEIVGPVRDTEIPEQPRG